MVRIILEGGRNRGAIASLLVVVVAAASVWAGYWVWHRDDEVVPVQRDIKDIIMRWRCPNGHVFPSWGTYGALPCPSCGQPAHIVITYECPQHGVFDALVMFDEQTGKPTNVQFETGKWINVSTTIPCPTCGGAMHPKQRDLFDNTGATEKQKAGGAPANPPT